MTPQVRIAGREALRAFVALAEDAADWLWQRGIHQWKPGSIRAQQAELAAKLGECWLVTAFAGGNLVAGCLLTRHLPGYWSGRTARAGGGAAYLERLVVSRASAGQGLSSSLVAAAEDLARDARLGTLRLDCWAGNETLKALYRGLGFRAVAEHKSDGHRICLFEKEVRGGTPV